MTEDERQTDPFVIDGARVTLRPHRPEDAAPAFALLHGNDAILRWLVWDGPRDRAELERYYGLWRVVRPDGEDYSLAVVERASGELIGSFGMRFGGHPGTGDVGYWIGTPYQGRGFGGEALAVAARLAFERLDAHALCAWVFEGNAASRAVLERNGFHHVRSVPARVVKGGRAIAEDYFTLLRAEWRERMDAPGRAGDASV